MSQKKRQRSADQEYRTALAAEERERITALQAQQDAKDARVESLALVQLAREIESSTSSLGGESLVLRRLLIALLETLTPEQRAEVRRRLGE